MAQYTNGDSPTPTPGPEWRVARELGYPQTLPSGNVVKLRPVTPDILIESGQVPDLLTPLVLRMLYDGIDGNAQEEEWRKLEEQPSAESALATIQLVKLVCKLAFVKPQVVDNPQSENEIHIDDIEPTDRMHVFSLATLGAAVLKNFRYEQTANVDITPDEPVQS